MNNSIILAGRSKQSTARRHAQGLHRGLSHFDGGSVAVEVSQAKCSPTLRYSAEYSVVKFIIFLVIYRGEVPPTRCERGREYVSSRRSKYCDPPLHQETRKKCYSISFRYLRELFTPSGYVRTLKYKLFVGAHRSMLIKIKHVSDSCVRHGKTCALAEVTAEPFLGSEAGGMVHRMSPHITCR